MYFKGGSCGCQVAVVAFMDGGFFYWFPNSVSCFQNLVAFSNYLFLLLLLLLQQVMQILAIKPDLLSMPLQHCSVIQGASCMRGSVTES